MAVLTQFRAAATDLLRRYQFARQAGMTFGDARDVWGVLGYKAVGGLIVQDYMDRYERGGIAGRVVDVLPAGTWRGEMYLEEDQNPDNETAFEKAWAELEKRLAIRQRFMQTDTLSRLSTYSVLLIGTKDGALDQELPKGQPEDLIYLQPYLGSGGPARGNRTNFTAGTGGFDADVTIGAYDLDTKSPRFAMPLYYQIRRPDIAIEAFQTNIHWSRVIHVAEGTLRNDVFGRPALERIFNHLEDLDKVVGGGSEAFWLRANQGLHLNVDKDMQISSTGPELTKMQEQAEEYQHQLTRMIRTRGVEVNALGSDVANFQSPADVIITLIAGSTGIPKRLLVGSERGELASTQDRENFRDLISGRQTNFAAPNIVRPFVDRLIKYGYLPKPAKDYEVKWPTIDVLTEVERSQGASGWASVNSSMQKTVFTEDEIREKWANLRPLTEDQKKAIEEEAAKKMADQQALIAAKTPVKPGEEDKGEKTFPKAAEAADDELIRILEQAIEEGADEVVEAIVGLGGPGSGRYPKGSGEQGSSGGKGSSSSKTRPIEEVEKIAAAMLHNFKQSMRNDALKSGQWWSEGSTQVDPVEKNAYGKPEFTFGVRDFGAWQVPADAEGSAEDGDFEDYDWMEPTPATVARLEKYVKSQKEIYPDLDITWHSGEKNWIYVNVGQKLKTLGGPGSGRYPKGSGKATGGVFSRPVPVQAVRSDGNHPVKKFGKVSSFEEAEALVNEMEEDGSWPEGYDAVIEPGDGSKHMFTDQWDDISDDVKTLGGEGSGRYPKGSGKQPASAGFVKGSKAQQKALGLPPAWTDVMINPDPKGALLATGKDAAGRTQYRYSAKHTEQASAAKHGRVAAFGKELPALRKQIDKDYDTDEAVVLDLIDKTSFRVGSDRDTKAKVKAYGATTLLDEHVKIKGDTIEFEFVAKKGTVVHKTIQDARLAAALKERKAKSDGGPLFATDDKKVRDYMGKTTPDFTPKDFRTWNATREALSVIKTMPKPKSARALQSAKLAVGTHVGTILGHTEKGGGKIALKSYISPSVFVKWEASQ